MKVEQKGNVLKVDASDVLNEVNLKNTDLSEVDNDTANLIVEIYNIKKKMKKPVQLVLF